MISKQELSAQKVVSYLMDFEDHFTNHKFNNLYWTGFEKFIKDDDPSPEFYQKVLDGEAEATPNVSCNDLSDSAEDEEVFETVFPELSNQSELLDGADGTTHDTAVEENSGSDRSCPPKA